MRISLQLKMDDLNKAEYAPIQITVSWAGKRGRESTGERTKPEWWDGKEVRNVKGSYSGHINDRLYRLKNALERADQAAADRHEQLSEEQMRQLLRDTHSPEQVASAPAPPPAPAGPDLTQLSVPELFNRCMKEQGAKESKKTGRARARTTLSNLNGSYEKLSEFEAVRGEPLQLARLEAPR